MIEYLQALKIPEKTDVFNQAKEVKGDLLAYFNEGIKDPTIADFDSLAIPVLSFLYKDVDKLEKGIYSNSEEKDESVMTRNKPIYRAIKTEFFKFICTNDPVYKKDREKIIGEFDNVVIHMSGVIAASIGAVHVSTGFGITIGLVAALVAVMLKMAIKIGIGSWCDSLV